MASYDEEMFIQRAEKRQAQEESQTYRQMISDLSSDVAELGAALKAYHEFASLRRTELGMLSDEMEAVDAQAKAALINAGILPKPEQAEQAGQPTDDLGMF